jgi:hypothetical protein
VFLELSAFSRIPEFIEKTKYIHYLQKMEDSAQAEGYKVNQLELVLFQFGKNLKQSVASLRESREV